MEGLVPASRVMPVFDSGGGIWGEESMPTSGEEAWREGGMTDGSWVVMV